MHALSVLVVALALQAAPAAPESRPFPGRAERLELFQDLVAFIRAHHVFAPATEANLGRKWTDDLPGLEREFAEAATVSKLRAAVNHLQASLHDVHCLYYPGWSPWLSAGFAADVEWINGKPRFYVAKVSEPRLAGSVAVGDLIVEVDGVPADQLLKRFALESENNSWRTIALDVARFLGSRSSSTGEVEDGKPLRVRFQKRSGGGPRTVELAWKAPPPAKQPEIWGPQDAHAPRGESTWIG